MKRIVCRSRSEVRLAVFALIVSPRLLFGQFLNPLPQTFNSCDFCLAAQGISPLEVGSSGMRIDVRYLSVGTLYQDGSRTTNADRELETHLTQQYSIFYAVTNSMSIAALVPVPLRHSEQLGSSGQLVTGNQFGIGDVSFLARYKPFVIHDMEDTYIVSLTGGIKLPTGKTDGRDSQGDLLDAHIQLGTGSTDLLLGTSGFAAFGRTALIINLLGALTGKGANGHQFGNSMNYDLTVRYKLWPDGYDFPQLFAAVGFSGELRGHEKQGGIIDPNSGGNVLYVSPGVQLFVSPALTLEMSYQRPVAHSLFGQQLGEDYRFSSGLQILF